MFLDVKNGINCGITKLMSQTMINDTFKCYADGSVETFSIIPEIEGITIDLKGVLVFDEYKTKGKKEYNIYIYNLFI